jgi:hypothetical protein
MGTNSAFAQYYTKANSKWFFGFNAGVDFSSGSPVSFYARNMGSDEGAAGVCDLNGNTLFYTDGTIAINRLGDVMGYGFNLTPFNTYGSCTHAAQIVQNLGNLNQYYVFSLQEDIRFVNPGDPYGGRLCYSIVDMSLDSARGSVLDSVKGIMLDSVLSEKMIAIPGNNCNVWLINHSRDLPRFYAREVTATGIGLPVVSNVGTNGAIGYYAQGQITSSPDRTKIAMFSCQMITNDRSLELYKFDPNTGIISDAQILQNDARGYGCEFSPDSKRLYAQEGADSNVKVVQYNCSLPSLSAILASKSIVFEDTPRYAIFGLKLAPDNKIYLIANNPDSLDCIAAPNNSASTSGYQKNVVRLTLGSRGVFGMPNVYVTADTSCSIIKRLSTPTTELSNTLLAYPNPATTVINITTPAASGMVTVCDLTGRQLLAKTVTTAITSLDTGSLIKGLYTVSYTDAMGARTTQKIMVE